MKDWKLTVKKQMKEIGISQEKLAEVLGCTQGAIGHWLNGRRQADINTINLILSAVGLPPLTIGSENVIHLPKPQVNNVKVYDENDPLEDDEVEIPLIEDVELSAGCGRINGNEFKSNTKLRFDKSTLTKLGVSFPYAVCVKVSGNSMEPVIPDGSTIGIDTSQTKIVDGKVYAVIIENELARVKQLYRETGNRVKLRSFNQNEYADQYYNLDDIKVVGRLFWSSVLWD